MQHSFEAQRAPDYLLLSLSVLLDRLDNTIVLDLCLWEKEIVKYVGLVFHFNLRALFPGLIQVSQEMIHI